MRFIIGHNLRCHQHNDTLSRNTSKCYLTYGCQFYLYYLDIKSDIIRYNLIISIEVGAK